MKEIIKRLSSWKAPGLDELPAGFLKACGPALTKVLVHLLNSSCRLGYYPARFRKAKVVILRKQGKKPEEYHEAGGWRPISLLSIVGKVLEAAVAARVTAAAESNGSLPELQMGNRANRSTEVALSTLTEVPSTQYTMADSPILCWNQDYRPGWWRGPGDSPRVDRPSSTSKTK
ncbi:uncharacterized protein CPUR_04549 [Claviceps purpurea 20.1]|uniref:Uncharacterized protein n=1 Tax=Claviceps purpurea (strain 20.1) TaxID=1111077 RepID=M1W6T7_CLAP2|nr:uncharacterized protein CPUR_04549 [Claviceps purpurea 20.1]